MSHKDSHRVSVIIPTIGRDTLELTKKSLEDQTRKPDEIIVSFDEKFYGPSWPRNRGIEKATGDLIAFADDDCLYQPNWLEGMISALDKYHADGVGGSYSEDDSLLRDIRNRKGYPTEEGEDKSRFCGTGGNVMYRKQSLDKIRAEEGYVFDETLWTSEDSDLACRLKYIGFKLFYVPINPRHLRRVGFYEYLKMQYFRGSGIAGLHMKSEREKRDLMGKSLLTADQGSRLSRYFLIFWRKILGPFDFHHFSSFRNYVYGWFGPKAEMIGFAKEMLALKFKRK